MIAVLEALVHLVRAREVLEKGFTVRTWDAKIFYLRCEFVKCLKAISYVERYYAKNFTINFETRWMKFRSCYGVLWLARK